MYDPGPNPRHQILLAHDFIRGGSQDDQYVESTRTQFDSETFFCEKPFAYEQIERTKRQSAAGLI